MKILKAKSLAAPAECPLCKGKLVTKAGKKVCANTYANTRKGTTECEWKHTAEYEQVFSKIKKLIDMNPGTILQVVVEEGAINPKTGKAPSVARTTDKLAGNQYELGDKWVVKIDSKGHCKVTEAEAKNEAVGKFAEYTTGEALPSKRQRLPKFQQF